MQIWIIYRRTMISPELIDHLTFLSHLQKITNIVSNVENLISNDFQNNWFLNWFTVRDTKQKVRSSLRDVGNVNVIKLKRSAGAFLVFFSWNWDIRKFYKRVQILGKNFRQINEKGRTRNCLATNAFPCLTNVRRVSHLIFGLK